MSPRLESRGGMRFFLLAAFLLASAGCGEKVQGRPGLVPVTGKVTLDGKPLTTGSISFIASDGKEAFTSQLDASGNYKLAASPTDPGALPGEYKVIVIAVEQANPASGQSGQPPKGSGMDAMLSKAKGESGGPAEPKSLVPEKYNNPETSGLTASVKAGTNSIDFPLKSS